MVCRIFEQFVRPWTDYYLRPGNVAGLILAEYGSEGEFDHMDTPYPREGICKQLPPNGNRYMGIVESMLGHVDKANTYFQMYLDHLSRKASLAKGDFKKEYEKEINMLETRIGQLRPLH